MASRGEDEGWSEETICSICFDFFTEPISLQCGHSFCLSCISQAWDTTGRNSCPQCRATFPERDLKVNRALANLSEKARKLKPNEKEKEGKFHCEEHQEELKLFCETDKKLVCVICSVSREHRSHSLMPINEAVEIYKGQVQFSMELLMGQKSEISLSEVQQKEKINEVKDQSHCLQNNVTSEFTKMHQYLTEKEEHCIKDLREKEQIILDAMEVNLQEIQANLTSIEEQISKLQNQMEQRNHVIFLKEETSQANWSNTTYSVLPVTEGAMSMEKFNSPFLFFVWREMRNDVSPVSVTLDVDTANKLLEVSVDLRTVRWTRRQRKLADTWKRFTVWPCVLGWVGFASGRHYWEVEVAGNRSWGLGVAAESVERKRRVDLTPGNGFWTIQRTEDRFNVNASRPFLLPAMLIPGKVGVYLNYESGTVSFYGADTSFHLHTFSGNKFTEKLYPFLWTFDEKTPLKI